MFSVVFILADLCNESKRNITRCSFFSKQKTHSCQNSAAKRTNNANLYRKPPPLNTAAAQSYPNILRFPACWQLTVSMAAWKRSGPGSKKPLWSRGEAAESKVTTRRGPRARHNLPTGVPGAITAINCRSASVGNPGVDNARHETFQSKGPGGE